jgi:hypothetical protein
MNERIFELAKQADLIQWDTLPSGARTPDHESVAKARKFALLIVRECQKLNSKELSITAIERLLPLYREHFGVEE